MGNIKKRILYHKRVLLQFVLLVLGVVLMGLGWARGDAQEIMDKAIMVCLGCIGLG